MPSQASHQDAADALVAAVADASPTQVAQETSAMVVHQPSATQASVVQTHQTVLPADEQHPVYPSPALQPHRDVSKVVVPISASTVVSVHHLQQSQLHQDSRVRYTFAQAS